MNWDKFRGSNPAIFVLPPYSMVVKSEKKRICSSMSKFFPYIVNSILKGLCCPGKKGSAAQGRRALLPMEAKRVTKVASLWKNAQKQSSICLVKKMMLVNFVLQQNILSLCKIFICTFHIIDCIWDLIINIIIHTYKQW